MSALAVLAAAVTAAPSPLPAIACGPIPVVQTQSTTPMRPRKLGDLPDGFLSRAVLLKIGGCSMKIVREPAGLKGGVWRYEPDTPAVMPLVPAASAGGR